MFAQSFVYRRFSLLIFLTITSVARAQHGNEGDLSAKQLEVAAPLKVETFAADPLFENPVAFSIDEKGRFFISETHRYKDSIFDIWKADDRWKMTDFSFRTVEERNAFLAKEYATNLSYLTKDSELIRLVEDKDGDGKADASSVFADGFNKIVSGTAAGVLARHGELWFTCIPDLWKFKYDSAGKKVSQEVLHTGYGVKISVSGHDLHGLVMGPDGKVYFSVGDRGANVKSKEGTPVESIDTGSVFRCNPDGTDLEIFATGVRNPQELAFDEFGNLWAHDNDTSGDDKSRVLHIVEGGDYGWRQAYQFMEGFGPWVQERVWQGNIDDVLPPAGYGAQGPAGLTYYPGVGLPEKYQRHFFAADFPQGVWSYTFVPNGASYSITNKEHFLWGFGATDVEVGPDGNVYISDWGKSYNMPNAGRIYRVFNPAATNNAKIAEVKKLLSEGTEARSIDELAKLLGHDDMRVRMDAQFALVKRGASSIAALEKIAHGKGSEREKLHGVWALAQLGRNPAAAKVLVALVKNSDAQSTEIQAHLARVAGDLKLQGVSADLLRLLKNSDARVRFHAAMSLGKLKDKNALPAITAMLMSNADKDPFLVHAGVWALVNIGDMSSILSAVQSENVSVRRAALLSLRRMKSPEIQQFLVDSEPRLALEAARAINDVPIPGAMHGLALQLEDCKCSFPAELKMSAFSRTINANLRLGRPENFTLIANFLFKHNVPEEARAEALNALADWENPGPLDRVVGIYRPLTNDRVKLSREALANLLTTPVEGASEKMSAAGIRCVRKLKIQELAPSVLHVFLRTNASAALRVSALQTLAELKASQLRNAVEAGLTDKEPLVRAEAIKLVGQLEPAAAAPLLEKLLTTETDIRIGQSVYAALGDLKDGAADQIIAKRLDELIAGKIQPQLQLDLLEAAEKRKEAVVGEKLKKYRATFSQSDALSEYRACLLGGDSELGKKLFNENDAIGCLRCHAIKGKGGIVGPDLGGVAKRHPREYLLESILYPNKQIAPGFENVVLTLKDGRSVAGLVKSETDAELVLNSPEDGVMTIAKSDITKRDRSQSAMPEGLSSLMNKRDLRNLLEYLGKLK